MKMLKKFSLLVPFLFLDLRIRFIFFLSYFLSFLKDTEDGPGSPIGLRPKKSVSSGPLQFNNWSMVSVCPSSHECMREAAKHEISVRVHEVIAKCDSNFSSA